MIRVANTISKREKRRQLMLHDVMEGLSGQEKYLPAKYFYDSNGCDLFDQICELPEYYLTRTEASILESNIEEIADTVNQYSLMIELGSGSSNKTRMLLEEASELSAYAPVDIAGDYLQSVANDLSLQFPTLEIHPIIGDFLNPIRIPHEIEERFPRMVYFPGSTIGNLNPDQATKLFLNQQKTCGADGGFLLGMDLHKEKTILEAAYNDSQGVTAEFNMNILRHIANTLNIEIDYGLFEHVAIYNEEFQRIEMHLRSRENQSITIGGQRIEISRDELICTEHSNKYTTERLERVIEPTHWTIKKSWRDENDWFEVVFLELS